MALTVWERRALELVVAASEAALSEIDRRWLACVEQISSMTESAGRQAQLKEASEER